MSKNNFIEAITSSYTFNTSSIFLGSGVWNSEIIATAKVSLPKGVSRRKERSTLDEVMASPVAKQVGREIVRTVFGVLFGMSSRRRRIF
jgi:hypothetical protein